MSTSTSVVRFPRFLLRLGVPLYGLMLASCMVGPNYTTPEARIQGKWKKRQGVSDRPSAFADSTWWRQFNDPTLNQLVDVAYRNNPSLQSAGVRILQARAQLNETIGNLFPQKQNLVLSTRGNLVSNPSDFWTPLESGQNFLASQALLSVSWEIDFWGKYRRQIQSDKASYLATVAAYDSILVTLISDVASTYVNIRTLQDRIRVTKENVLQQYKGVEMAEARARAGQVGQLDVAQARAQLAQTQAQLPALQDALQRSENGLGVLLGETPAQAEGRVSRGGRIPSAPASVAVGIPIDLLRRRPDVRQAGLEAASQSAKIGVEFAKILPSFSLNGSFGYSTGSESFSFSQIFNWQQTLLNSAGSLVVPIFNYGRLINQVRVQDASFQRAILHYQEVVLNAQREVEDGLSAFTQGKNRVAHLETAVAAANNACRLAAAQYEAGTTDYTTILTAEKQRLAVEDALAETRGQVAIGLITIYRSLGGGWQMRSGGDVISDETRRQMAARTNWGTLLEPSRHLPAATDFPPAP